MQEEEIIFGGEKKLAAAIREAYEIFHPKAIAVFATCPVGLIGDDVHAVAREMTEELGINVFGFSCEGYKGVSQSAGHHIANNGAVQARRRHGATCRPSARTPFRINLLGEYNIGGDAFELETAPRPVRHHAGRDLQRQRRATTEFAHARTPPTSTSSCATARSTTWPR